MRGYASKYNPDQPAKEAPSFYNGSVLNFVQDTQRLITKLSPADGEMILRDLNAAIWPKQYSQQDVIRFLDLAIKDIEEFLKKNGAA